MNVCVKNGHCKELLRARWQRFPIFTIARDLFSILMLPDMSSSR
jgi:hypothetical protein